MNIYKKITRRFELISLATGVAIAKQTLDWVNETAIVNESLGFLLFLFISVLFTDLFSFLLRTIFERTRIIRRILLGKHYVEGTWLEFITDEKGLVSVGIAHIEPHGYELRIHGCNFDKNLNVNYNFSSDIGMTQMEWPVFKYSYEDRPHHGENRSLRGSAHIKFCSPSPRPKEYYGSFMHANSGKQRGIEARKIEDPQKLRTLLDPDKKREVIRSIINEYELPTEKSFENTSLSSTHYPNKSKLLYGE